MTTREELEQSHEHQSGGQRRIQQPNQQQHQLHHRDAVAVPVLRGVWGASHDSVVIRSQQQHHQRGMLSSSASSPSISATTSADNAPTHLLNPQRLHSRFAAAKESASPCEHPQQHQSPILLPPAKWHHARASMPTTTSSYDGGDDDHIDDGQEDEEYHREGNQSSKKSKKIYEPQSQQQQNRHPVSMSSSSSPPISSRQLHLDRQPPYPLLRPPPARGSSYSLTPPVASLSLLSSSRQTIQSSSPPGESKISSVRSTTPSQSAETQQSEQQQQAEPLVANKKRTRYLRDTDRRNIIQRIENGEKQAALAREFGVTRAAICHIKKNRKEIITRYDLLVQSAKELDNSNRMAAGCPSVEEPVTVLEVRSQAVLIMLTTLRNVTTSPAEFRRAACRLIMMLLEEAIASLGSKTVEITTPSGHTYLGRQQVDPLCGVVIDDAGYPFLKFFNQMEPDATRGYIHMKQVDLRRRSSSSGGSGAAGGKSLPHEWRAERTDLPPHVATCKVLLFSGTSSDGGSTCKAIEVLRGLQIPEKRICVVTILSASEAVTALCSQFPDVKIITAAVDADLDAQTGELLPGLGDFMARYNSD